MNNKGLVSIVVIIVMASLVLGAVGLLILNNPNLLKSQEFFASDGCQFIQNKDTPKLAYTEVLANQAYFKCDADECLVSGMIDIQQTTEAPITGFICRAGTCREGRKIFNTFDECDDSKNWCLGTTQIGSSTCPKSQCSETTIGGNNYVADWNFCPEGNPNYEYCQGELKTATGQGKKYTYLKPPGNYLLQKTSFDELNFLPTYTSGIGVENFELFVKKYDCSCLPAIEDGTACSSEQKMCKPLIKEFISCDRSTSIAQSSAKTECEASGCINCIDKGGQYKTYGCKYPQGWGWAYECRDNNRYQICDGEQTIGQSTCNKFNSVKTCSTGQSCFVDSTNKIGEGLGGCKCPDDPCTLGDKQKISDTTYQECTTIGKCLGWSTTLNCLNGLVFDENLQDCVCDPITTCDPTLKSCSSSSIIEECVDYKIGDKTCYKKQNTDCLGEKECKDGNCGCEEVDSCELNEIKCIDENSYSECSKDPNSINSCFDYRFIPNKNIGGELGSEEICNLNTNKIEFKPGCSNDPADACDDNHNCVDNTCQPKTSGGDYCNINSDEPDCFNLGQIKTCELFSDDVYKWETTDCETTHECKTIVGTDDCRPKTSGDFCSASDKDKCLNGNLETCVRQGSTSVYKKEIIDVDNNQLCKINSNTDDEIVCKTSYPYCLSSTSSQCLSGNDNIREVCKLDPDGNGCYKFKEESCSFDKQCFNGVCEKFGCGALQSEGFECSSTTDTNNIEVEQCINNGCVEASDDFTATIEDYLQDNIKCNENKDGILEVVIYEKGIDTNYVNVYRWEAKEQCGTTTPICIDL